MVKDLVGLYQNLLESTQLLLSAHEDLALVVARIRHSITLHVFEKRVCVSFYFISGESLSLLMKLDVGIPLAGVCCKVYCYATTHVEDTVPVSELSHVSGALFQHSTAGNKAEPRTLWWCCFACHPLILITD